MALWGRTINPHFSQTGLDPNYGSPGLTPEDMGDCNAACALHRLLSSAPMFSAFFWAA